MSRLVGVEEVRSAAERLAGVVDSTPLQDSRAVSQRAGVRTLLKCEHLQRTGSFKLRGAYNRMVRLTADQRSRGVVCASAGNHAQGVALSAQLLGIDCRVVMPTTAPLPKVTATRGYGAEVVLAGGHVGESLEVALTEADHGRTFVHPFDHPHIIAGQGTLGLELVEQVPDVGTVVVPVGGGGLIAGIAVALRALRPGVRIVGVQAAGAAAFPASLAAGHPVSLDRVQTMADGIAVSRPGDLTFAHVSALVDDVVTVTDEELARAVLLLAERAKQVVEPSGAAAVAAVLDPERMDMAAPVVALLCGGNVDPLLLARIISSGLFEEGRYLSIRTRLADRPGSLSALLGLLATAQANVVGIAHHRLATRLGVLEVEVEVELETRGAGHIRELVDLLAAHGYPVE